MEPTNNNVRIYLKSDKENHDVLKDASSYEKYIILMNEVLQSENKDYRLKINNLEHQLSTTEEENDKNENSNRYMKGFLKNMVLISRLNKQKANDYENIANVSRNSVNQWKIKAKKHCRYMQCILVIVVALFHEFNIFSISQNTIIAIIFMIFSAFHDSTIQNMTLPNFSTYHSSISNTEKELTDLEKGNDFLNDLVDVM